MLVHGRGALILFGPALLIFLFAIITSLGDEALGGADDASFFEIWYGIFLLAMGYLATSASLPDLKTAEGRQGFLTLPASNTEKWFAKWLITGPVYALVMTAGYALLTLLANAIIGLFELGGFVPFQPFTDTVGDLLLVYLLVVHPIALLGAITFNRWAFAKTAGVALALAFGFGMLALLVFRIVFYDHITGFFNVGNININSEIGAGFDSVWTTAAFALTLLAASYFKFREKQV